MSLHSCHTLMHHKRWADRGLTSIVGEAQDRITSDDWKFVLMLLDHIQVVDEIFCHHLEGRPHGHRAARSASLPSFEALDGNAGATADWYALYVDSVEPERLDEPVSFTFTNGQPARMTRSQMLLHIATHSAGHRGQIALLLQKNGLAPLANRLTDFFAAEEAKHSDTLPNG